MCLLSISTHFTYNSIRALLLMTSSKVFMLVSRLIHHIHTLEGV